MVPVTRSNKTLQDHIMVPPKKTIAVQKHTSQRNTLWWHLIHTVYLYTKQKNKYIYRFLFASFNRLVSLTVFVYIYIYFCLYIYAYVKWKNKKSAVRTVTFCPPDLSGAQVHLALDHARAAEDCEVTTGRWTKRGGSWFGAIEILVALVLFVGKNIGCMGIYG